MDLVFLNNSIKFWVIALGVFCVVLFVVPALKAVFARKIRADERSEGPSIGTRVLALVNNTKWFFPLVVGAFLGSMFLELPGKADSILKSGLIIALLAQGGIWAVTALSLFLERQRQIREREDPGSITTLNAVGFLGRIGIWTLVLLLALDNLGVNITALVAGLGVGGVAVALAVQNILGDLFAALSIVLDKPFVVGDFLSIDEILGSVEHVGLKTTRLRSLSGEQVVLSNSDLLNSRIRNYGRMFQRRVVFKIGVTYQTPRDKLKEISKILKDAVEAQNNVRFDRAHFYEYGDFSLNYETVYYVLAADYNQYMDTQQAINLYIHEKFEEDGIEFAYPTQTLHIGTKGTDLFETIGIGASK